MHEYQSPYQSQDITELAKALLSVQTQLQPALKDAENPFTKSNYATLNSVMESCRGTMLTNGIWMTQYPVPAPEHLGGGYLGLVTKLTHAESGQWQSSLAVVPLPKNDPQGMGSAMTYTRRYALCAMLGIVTEDDDAEGAKMPTKQAERARRARNTPRTQKSPLGDASQGESSQAALKSPPQRGDFPGLPRIDGISYQSITATDGRPCIIATGHTQPKKELLMGAGFKWNAQRKMWWRYADAS